MQKMKEREIYICAFELIITCVWHRPYGRLQLTQTGRNVIRSGKHFWLLEQWLQLKDSVKEKREMKIISKKEENWKLLMNMSHIVITQLDINRLAHIDNK